MEKDLAHAATAVLLGLLLGLERQRSHKDEPELFAGIRTFPVITLGGYLAMATGHPWLLALFMAAVAGIAIAAYAGGGRRQGGATTEVVAVCAPLLGALVYTEQALLAAASTIVVTLLLTLKTPLHRLAGAVSEEEILAMLKFAVVAVIVLPLLPTEAYGPYDALVPRHIGYVVVILSGVSLGGYLLVRFLGSRTGWSLAGMLGGLVSSTAVTLSFSGKASAHPKLVRALGIGILLASTVLYARGLVLLFLFHRELAYHLVPRLLPLFALGLALAFSRYRRKGVEPAGAVGLGNPVELGRAFGLGLFFALVLVATRAAQAELGTRGLWATGALGGLLDVDSVAVAVARLTREGIAEVGPAGGAYLLATLSNLLVKGAMVWIIGGGALAREVLPYFAILALATGAALAF
jgi:uncharacterized membrane protein (DUF4010 family)